MPRNTFRDHMMKMITTTLSDCIESFVWNLFDTSRKSPGERLEPEHFLFLVLRNETILKVHLFQKNKRGNSNLLVKIKLASLWLKQNKKQQYIKHNLKNPRKLSKTNPTRYI